MRMARKLFVFAEEVVIFHAYCVRIHCTPNEFVCRRNPVKLSLPVAINENLTKLQRFVYAR